MRSPNHLRLLDDLFNRELADDAAEVAFHDEPDQAFAFGGSFGQELFGRCLNRLGIRLDFDLRDGFDGDGHTLLGVEILLRAPHRTTSTPATDRGRFRSSEKSPCRVPS